MLITASTLKILGQRRINMKRLKNGYILDFVYSIIYYLGCYINFLANEWNYTVGDNHPVSQFWSKIQRRRLLQQRQKTGKITCKIAGSFLQRNFATFGGCKYLLEHFRRMRLDPIREEFGISVIFVRYRYIIRYI